MTNSNTGRLLLAAISLLTAGGLAVPTSAAASTPIRTAGSSATSHQAAARAGQPESGGLHADVSGDSTPDGQAARAADMSGVTIRNRNSRSCLNAPGMDGGIVLQLNCNVRWGNKSWNVVQVRNRPGLYEVRNTTTGRCLEIAGWSRANGAAAMTWACHGGSNQRWWVTRRGDGYYELKNESSTRCLDVRFREDWTNAYQWGCHGGGEQQWAIF